MRKMAILLIAFAVLFAFSEVTQAIKQEETFEAIKWQDVFNDVNQDTSVVGTWNDKEYVINLRMLSPDLDMKLVFSYGKGSTDINGTPYGNDSSQLQKILNCKELPEYPGNTTCLNYQVYRRKQPGLFARVWEFTSTTVKKTCRFTVSTVVQAWNKCCNGIVTVVGKISNGLKGMVDWTIDTIIWLAEWVYNRLSWLAESIWNNTVWLTELTWNRTVWLAELTREQIAWLAEVSRESSVWLAEKAWTGLKWLAEKAWTGLKWLAEKTWTGSKWLAEYTWKEAKYLANWIWKAMKRNCKPLEPALEYVLETVEVVTKFYTEHVHEHLIGIQAKIIISTWSDTGYTIASALVMNFVVVAVYKLISWPVKSFYRRWRAYQEWKEAEEASWRLPPKRPQPKKRVWENPKKRKLYKPKN